ncbi:hypothetical protein HBI04_120030 [Parastagonospora nodorum]|nr:hypothetical protein HBI03_000090 [Parastagonospora nodorum]KAH4276271.1 hypothetical protein HBI04_120030 [Parastagonospora nodorum]
MQRETRTRLGYTLNKELKLTLNTLLLGPNKSLLFLALACLKDLGVSVILSSKELLALVMLRLLEAPSNSAQSLLTLMPVSLSYSYATALLRA